MYAEIGMNGFAERARRERMATGETVRKRSPETRDSLTAQEAQIARLAAEGCTNPEIGAQLFISPRTVEWHLRKVFTKLGISSRKELPAAQFESPAAAATPEHGRNGVRRLAARMYEQVHDPVGGSLGLSTLFAILPLVTLFVLLAGLRLRAYRAGLIALAVALTVAIAVYGMPVGQAFDSAAAGAAFGIFPIVWIVVNAVWIYTMTVATGHFQTLRRGVGAVSGDQRIQALIVGFSFGALLEALAGFGAPVAITGGHAARARLRAAEGGRRRAHRQYGAGGVRGDRHADHHALGGDRDQASATWARWSGASFRSLPCSCRS